ncbi:MAG: sugar-transfer associated ATP-grasp domain-containing protein [Bacteroidota bacterium]|nr:sugar-transfer associated ATP-grasp domain-containing protein [Bacteroidota bacterium]
MFYEKEISASELVTDFLKDRERKPILQIMGETFLLFFRSGRFPRHYYSRFLFKKDSSNIFDYFPDSYFEKVKPVFNDKEAREVLENKLYFDFYFSQFGISLPRILMYNHRNIFVVDNRIKEVNCVEEFRTLMSGILKNKSVSKLLFIKKTFWSYGGDQIYKVSPEQVENDPEMINNLYSAVIKSGFLFQETIKQHPELDRLNPSCLNTMRLDTFIDQDGKIEVLSGFIRTSVTNRHVDNVSSGGCQVPLDIETGRLKKYAYRVLKMSGVKLLTEHPVTKTTFEGYMIPYFREAKELVIKAGGLYPCLRLVGWDVGISENGPVLIEGNSDYNMAGNDLADGGYRANPVFRKVIKEYNELKKIKGNHN